MPSVRFFAPDTDAYVDSVKRHAEEFTQKPGPDIEFRIIPTDLYFSDEIRSFLDGEERADVFMSGPVLLRDHIGGGLVEALDPWLETTDAEFDFSDFFDSHRGGLFGVRLFIAASSLQMMATTIASLWTDGMKEGLRT